MIVKVALDMKGHRFAATLVESASSSVVGIDKDGGRVTTLDWDEEGFVANGHDLGMADIDDTADIYDELRRLLFAKIAEVVS